MKIKLVSIYQYNTITINDFFKFICLKSLLKVKTFDYADIKLINNDKWIKLKPRIKASSNINGHISLKLKK